MSDLRHALVEAFEKAFPRALIVEAVKETLPVNVILRATREGLELFLSPFVGFGRAFLSMQAAVDTAFREDTQVSAGTRVAHAQFDSLTGLPNRFLFHQQIEQAFARTRRSDDQLFILSIDLDKFKEVNDKFGHAIGDELLRTVAQRLRSNVLDPDTVARLGGDEFAILRSDGANQETVEGLAEVILGSVGVPYQIGGHQLTIQASIGIAGGPRRNESGYELLKNADLALYHAKAMGGGGYRSFTPELATKAGARKQLSTDLGTALDADQLKVIYEPIAELATGATDGYEALLQWHHPIHGIIPRYELSNILDNTELIVFLGDWMLREACMHAATWPQPLGIAVRLWPSQTADSHLAETILRTLEQTGLAASRLELQIAESTLRQDFQPTISNLQTLRKLGVRISLSEFGTGYASFSDLSIIPNDKIKLDRLFVDDIASEQKNFEIIKTIGAVGNNLGLIMAADGIATEEQRELLLGAGFVQGQGRLFGQPLSSEQLAKSLQAGALLDKRARANSHRA